MYFELVKVATICSASDHPVLVDYCSTTVSTAVRNTQIFDPVYNSTQKYNLQAETAGFLSSSTACCASTSIAAQRSGERQLISNGNWRGSVLRPFTSIH